MRWHERQAGRKARRAALRRPFLNGFASLIVTGELNASRELERAALVFEPTAQEVSQAVQARGRDGGQVAFGQLGLHDPAHAVQDAKRDHGRWRCVAARRGVAGVVVPLCEIRWQVVNVGRPHGTPPTEILPGGGFCHAETGHTACQQMAAPGKGPAAGGRGVDSGEWRDVNFRNEANPDRKAGLRQSAGA